MPSSKLDEIVLGIDLGTGGVKAVLLSARVGVIRRAQRRLGTARPASGFSEQEPADWFKAAAACCKELLNDGTRPVAVGISGAAHIPVLLGADLSPVRPSILWNDTRSAEIATELDRRHGAEILAITGNVPSPAWTLPMLMWLNQHEPDALRQTRHLLLGKDVLVHRLTGVLVTDEGNAVSSMLADSNAKRWSTTLQDIAGLDVRAYPEVAEPQQVVGKVTNAAAKEFGIAEGTPVIAGLLDSLAELVALGITRPGNSMLRLGTAGGVMSVTERPLNDRRLITYPFVSGLWASQAFTSSCASAVSWFQNILDPGASSEGPAASRANSLTFEALDALAAKAHPGSTGLLFQPYLAGERAPHWDPSLRAGFVGASLEHTREHFVRAVLEGIGCSLADCRDLIVEIGGLTGTLRVTGGGMHSSILLSIVSDMLDSPLSLGTAEGSATGVAALAGTSVGIFPDINTALKGIGSARSQVFPNPAHTEIYAGVLQRYRALHGALQSFYHNHPFEPLQGTR